MKDGSVLSLLGLAQRAGKTVSGAFAVDKYLKKNTVPLAFLASDGSSETAGNYRRLAEQKRIPLLEIYTKEELGNALGKEQSVVVLITDKGFAKAIEDVLRTN